MKPLAYYIDTPETQALCAHFGDRLQELENQDLLDLQGAFSLTVASMNNEGIEHFDRYEVEHFEWAIRDFHELSLNVWHAIGCIEDMDVRYGPSFMLGLANIIYQRVQYS